MRTLLSKLRQPIHIDYISKYILKKNIKETKEELIELVNNGLITESELAKDYYVTKNQNI
jgi:hypothetical protein